LSTAYKVQINRKWCKNCGICLAFCPKNVFSFDEKKKLQIVNEIQCSGCLMCEKRCPDMCMKIIREEE